jgi:hypothetical protein
MKRDDFKKYFEILELTPEASLSEVKKSYYLFKDLYSGNSIVTRSVEDEISDGKKTGILNQIETAYQNLLNFFQEEPTASGRAGSIVSGEDFQDALSEITSFSGPVLKQIREKLNIGLHEIALVTKIQIHYLENIEEENYAALPDEVYTRGFVIAYAKHLSLDPKRVADDFMADYSMAGIDRKKPSRFW